MAMDIANCTCYAEGPVVSQDSQDRNLELSRDVPAVTSGSETQPLFGTVQQKPVNSQNHQGSALLILYKCVDYTVKFIYAIINLLSY